MAGKYVDGHGNIAFRLYHKDARSHEPANSKPDVSPLYSSSSIQREILRERDRGTPPDDIWESLWAVLHFNHPQLSNEALDAWVHKLTRPIY